MKRLTLDSSVFVAAFRESEEKHRVCKKLLDRIISGDFEVMEPYSVLVEVAAAVKRRTKSSAFAREVKNLILGIETVVFCELVRSRVEDAIELAVKNSLAGMDALVVQVAKENSAILVSLDAEMVKSAQGEVSIKIPEELV